MRFGRIVVSIVLKREITAVEEEEEEDSGRNCLERSFHDSRSETLCMEGNIS
jgi:hypothetical protein